MKLTNEYNCWSRDERVGKTGDVNVVFVTLKIEKEKIAIIKITGIFFNVCKSNICMMRVEVFTSYKKSHSEPKNVQSPKYFISVTK